mmetsp:Transcript_15805/g.20762  ORF Transcript_15805/g.20762 Transcript_15805/m.20762 type:complete len:264 (-) Transcript_15805:1613-2404(-)
MTRELDKAFDSACLDDVVKCIVLRAEGEHFSSGHDLGSKAQLDDRDFPQELSPLPRGEYLRWYTNDVEACLKWRRLRKPVIAALQGFCIYHGTVIASCADIVVASENLKYMPSLVEANLFPWAAGLQPQVLKSILLTQRFVLAPEALRLGIVNRIVPVNDLDDETLRLARLVAKGDSFHLWMMKKMVNSALDSAGMETHVRNSLDTWTAFRKDWDARTTKDAQTKDHGGNSKRLAPVEQSLKGEAWRQSLIASGQVEDGFSKL